MRAAKFLSQDDDTGGIKNSTFFRKDKEAQSVGSDGDVKLKSGPKEQGSSSKTVDHSISKSKFVSPKPNVDIKADAQKTNTTNEPYADTSKTVDNKPMMEIFKNVEEKQAIPSNTGDKKSDVLKSEAPQVNLQSNKTDGPGNGVGEKIKKFEKAAEDASAGSNPGTLRRKPREEKILVDNIEDIPPPATPFKDNPRSQPQMHDKEKTLPNADEPKHNLKQTKWQKSDSSSFESDSKRCEPQKIIKPEVKAMASPVEVTIRSPSLGAKIPEQFPSHGTAFRNVSAADAARPRCEDGIKMCKLKNKEKISISKGSSYFTRGSEEIWLVKKKDIEEIEERVFDSFRRAGGVCARTDPSTPSDCGQNAFSTMGRNKRPVYSRSESSDPQWAGNKAQTLKRHSSIACTCGHDKKARAKSAGPEATAKPEAIARHEATPRARTRSHGDDSQSNVLDKYETLV